MQGLALTTEQLFDVLSVYATAERTIDAVAATPGWHVIGAFTMPASYTVRVDALGSISDDSTIVMRVRLFDITPGSVGPVSGSEAQTASETDVQFFSGAFELQGGHVYQFQAEVTGGSGSSLYGVIRRATLAGIE